MDKLKNIILLSAALIFLHGLSYGQSEQKIGFVDISKAFDEYEKTKDFDKELEKKGDLKQEEREKLVKEIRDMREEIELLNDEARSKKEQGIESKVRSLQEFDQDAKSGLTKERDDMVRNILKEMDEVIAQYGKNHGYSIILNDRVLLYGDKAMDLTEEIIKVLNEGYKR